MPKLEMIEKTLKFIKIGWGVFDSIISIIFLLRQEKLLKINLEKNPSFVEYYWVIIFGFIGIQNVFAQGLMILRRTET